MSDHDDYLYAKADREECEYRAELATDELHAKIAELERRAEDAELVAWGLAGLSHLIITRIHNSHGPDYWKVSSRKTTQFGMDIPSGEDGMPTLTPDARAALLAAREREEK